MRKRSAKNGVRSEQNCGIGLTGGGDCAGIADFLSALALGLKPSLKMFGIKNAGAGLSVSPDEFGDQLILIDKSLAKKFKGQSSTPLGSSRVNALKEFPENVFANIKPYGFLYGTGGDDHLGMLAAISAKFPKKVIVGTFKSVDGDGCIGGKPAQMLGFRTAMERYRQDFWAIVQNGHTHGQVHVVEFFGRKSGKLTFESARKYPKDFAGLPSEEKRKIKSFRESVMILVPEKPVSLKKIVSEAVRIKNAQGSVVIAVAEGFLPPELASEMKRLAADGALKKQWLARELNPLKISSLVRDGDLALALKDPGLAAHFAETVWNSKLDAFGNVVSLSGIRHFIISALRELGGMKKVNELIRNYEARGATPCKYDSVMGEKIGKVAAGLINKGVFGGKAVVGEEGGSGGRAVLGGKAVVYFEGMNPLKVAPAVVPLVNVTNKNTLNNTDLYGNEMLRKNGVFF